MRKNHNSTAQPPTGGKKGQIKDNPKFYPYCEE